jgi:hypothetical protein
MKRILKNILEWFRVQVILHWIEVAVIVTFYLMIRSNSGEYGWWRTLLATEKRTAIWSPALNTSIARPFGGVTEPEVENGVGNFGNTYSNMVFTQKGFATSAEAGKVLEKRQKQEAYIEKYWSVAVSEMKKSGIPASITLAQGLLESNAGESRLAVHNNNHFGIKCFSRTCKRGHCSNFEDDSHKDFFRIYASPEASFEAHSYFLKKDRYKGLFKFSSKDYTSWAHGLKKAGYATDPYYGEKLVNLIEDLKLHRFDR